MKRILIFLLTVLLLTGCASGAQTSTDSGETVDSAETTDATEAADSGETTDSAGTSDITASSGNSGESATAEDGEETAAEEVPQEDPEPVPIYPHQLADGSYEISVDSSSSMFRVVKCILTVDEDSMTAAMTMSGQGYGMVYMGTREEAPLDAEENYIPFTLDAEKAKVFTVPVEALNMEIDCAAWSIRKETWYDRVLIFESELLSEDVIDMEASSTTSTASAVAPELSEGSYTIEVALSGGTGRASVESPAVLTVTPEQNVAVIRWSSPFYEYMLVDGVQYDPIQEEGNSTFELPVVLDTEMEVSASTIAMSQPHLIDYTLYFDSSTMKEAP